MNDKVPVQSLRIDRQKVFDGVQQCLRPHDPETQCYDCPYYGEDKTVNECEDELYRDLYSLLKSIPPTWRNGKAYCGDCGLLIPYKNQSKFCYTCGRMILWER